jgi:hypothetical protein
MRASDRAPLSNPDRPLDHRFDDCCHALPVISSSDRFSGLVIDFDGQISACRLP